MPRHNAFSQNCAHHLKRRLIFLHPTSSSNPRPPVTLGKTFYITWEKYMGETFNKIFIMEAFVFTIPRAQHPLLWPLTQRSKSIFQEVEPVFFIYKLSLVIIVGWMHRSERRRVWLFTPRAPAKGASVTNCNSRRVWGSVVTGCDGTEWGEGLGGPSKLKT